MFIGDGSQKEEIAVASRDGMTQISGASLTLRGSNSTDGALAMMGYRVDDWGDVAGDIVVDVSKFVLLQPQES